VITERELLDRDRFRLLADQQTQADGAYGRLVGYIPADAIGLYLMAVGALGGTIVNVPGQAGAAPAAQPHPKGMWIAFGITFLLAPFLSFVGTLRDGITWWQRAQWFQVGSSPFAFTAWAFAIGGPFASLDFWSAQVGAVILFLASVVIVAFDKLCDFIAKVNAKKKEREPGGITPA
jgi:hypothetical protein